MSESVIAKKYILPAAILAGFATWIVLGGAGFFLLRTLSLSYALAEPTKAYTLPMLLSRLTVGVVCTLAAGAVATTVAKGSLSASYWLAVALFLLSAPIHLPTHLGISVWADYPQWYHYAYLVPLMPLTIFGGYLVVRLRSSGNK